MATTHGQLVNLSAMETGYLVVLVAALVAVAVICGYLLVKLVSGR